MKFYLYLKGRVVGPYRAAELEELFSGLAPDTLVCTEPDYESGHPLWRRAGLLPELAGCVGVPPTGDASAPEPRRGLRLNILSTDDDSNIRSLLWNMLNDAGHNVEFAKDGEEVFRRLAGKTYDLVILDVNIPKMNGYKVSELLHEKLPSPPKVIIFTGRDLEQEKLQFVCSGADAILNKGTGNDKLMETIEGLFSVNPAAESPLAGPQFTPEPQPPVIEEASRAREAVPALAATPEPPPPPTAPGAVPAAAAAPAPAAGGTEAALRALLQENKALRAGLADVRRVLGHIELEYMQLEGQFEKQGAKAQEVSRQSALKLAAEWQSLRSLLGGILLLLLLCLLFVLLSRPC